MAKDIYHEMVRGALESEGWIVTADPLTLSAGKRGVYVDLAAEKPIFAERENRKIAVEVKSFVSPSPVKEFETALGQYLLYKVLLAKQEPNRTLYLAIREEIYAGFFAEEIVQFTLETHPIYLIVFDPEKGGNLKWMN